MATIDKRERKDGTKYRARVRVNGVTKVATFDRLKDAKRWAIQTEADVMDGKHGFSLKNKTIAQAINLYRAEVLPTKKSQSMVSYLEWWEKVVDRTPLDKCTAAKIREWLDAKAKEVSPRTGKPVSPASINRLASALSAVLNYAVEKTWLSRNPARDIKKQTEPRGRLRYLSDDERARLLESCKEGPPHLYPIVVLALSTGARRGEILNLKWSQVDFKRKAIILDETKNNERRTLPIVGHALDVLKDWRDQVEGEAVFPDDIKTSWYSALYRAGITNFRFHDLRHSCASYLAMNNVPLRTIAEILGHKSLNMVMRYAHLSHDYQKNILENLSEGLFQ